jgi:hypothetical protein
MEASVLCFLELGYGNADKQAWLAKYATWPSHDNTYSAPGAQIVD